MPPPARPASRHPASIYKRLAEAKVISQIEAKVISQIEASTRKPYKDETTFSLPHPDRNRIIDADKQEETLNKRRERLREFEIELNTRKETLDLREQDIEKRMAEYKRMKEKVKTVTTKDDVEPGTFLWSEEHGKIIYIEPEEPERRVIRDPKTGLIVGFRHVSHCEGDVAQTVARKEIENRRLDDVDYGYIPGSKRMIRS